MAEFFELEEVLDPRVLTEQYREEAGRYVSNPILDFYSTQMKDIGGDRFEFAYRAAMTTPAPGNLRGQPARVLQPTGLSDRTVFMHRAFNTLDLSLNSLQMLREPENMTLQKMGRTEILRQQEDFGDRHKIFRAVVCAKSLIDGIVYFDGDGVVLESSSGAAYSVDLSVPSSHKSQLNSPSASFSGNIIGLAWDNASAKIFDDLDDIRIAARELNAEMPKHIWLHDTAKRWLRDNTQLLGYLQASPEKADRILAGSMIEDLNGWTWHFDSSTYTSSAGTTVPYIPTTKALITPDVGPWLRAANGSELIPTQVGVFGTLQEAVGNMQELFGMFSYVALQHNSARLSLFMGDNFTYVFANPNAVWAPTVDF